MSRIAGIYFSEVVRPLRVTFATALGQKDVIRSLMVRVTLEDGSSGMGECPTSAAFRGETVPVMKALLMGLARTLKGRPIEGWAEETVRIRKDHGTFPMAVSGLETALFRASLAAKGAGEHAFWGGRAKEIETDLTMPFLPGHPTLVRWLGYGVRKGFRAFKVKVSGDVEKDMAFLSFLRDAAPKRPGHFTLRLDGNQGYTVKTFFTMIDALHSNGFAVELFEQPLRKDDFKGLREIMPRSPVPIILDEMVVTGEDARRAAEEGLGHGVNIKIAKSGIVESGKIVAVAREHGLKLMIGCMTETMVGLSAGIHLAAGSDCFDYVDLDGIYFLSHRNRWRDIALDPPRFIID